MTNLKIHSAAQKIGSCPCSIQLDINDANAFVFFALEHESKKDVRDEQMMRYLIGIAKKLPVSNYSDLYKYC